MNKLVYGFLLAFCLGYITNDFIHGSKLSPIASAHADEFEDDSEINLDDLLRDLEFRRAVIGIVEDCIVDDSKITC